MTLLKKKLLGYAALALLLMGMVGGAGAYWWFRPSASRAMAAYQEAVALGDLTAQRNALISLTKADEDIPEYWVELGRLNLRMGDYQSAYAALSRAHELNRTDVEVLTGLTQLALLSGQSELAGMHADLLAKLSPGNPVVLMVRADQALRAGELDEAAAAADKLLQSSPHDSYVIMLKARIFLARDHLDEARQLLADHVSAKPHDRAAMYALAAICENQGDWRQAAFVYARIVADNRRDSLGALRLVEAALRANDLALAERATTAMLATRPARPVLDSLFSLWVDVASAPMPNAARIAAQSSGQNRAAFADYFNRLGLPKATAALVGLMPQRPVTHENAAANAAIGGALALEGRRPEAAALLSEVLELEPDETYALRARLALLLSERKGKAALIDAQRLVTASADDPGYRILLAQAYRAAGNQRQSRMTLWDAFRDIPANETIYRQLRATPGTGGATEDIERRRIDEEFADQKRKKLAKALAA